MSNNANNKNKIIKNTIVYVRKLLKNEYKNLQRELKREKGRKK